MTPLEVLLEGYLAAKGRMGIVQVGANDGKINDPIYPFVMRNKSATSILLVEPQAEIIPFLKENYADHPDATIHRGAIGTGESLVLFRVKPELWDSYQPPYMQDAPAYRVPSGFASSSIQHVLQHAKGNFRHDVRLEDCVEEFSIPCTTLHGLLSSLSWPHEVDVLQVDTEGADDEVIYASDTDRLKPRLINFERSHLGEERRHRLETFLADRGYRLLPWSGSDTVAILHS